jgi:carbamate kinase
MKLVVALGGNALLRRNEPATADIQRSNVAKAGEVLARLADHHQLTVTHGNGPQVGLLALQAAAYTEVEPYPLDVLGAESEGMIGYLLEQDLSARLVEREVATLLTQVEVSSDDPAFDRPTKPIGPVYSAEVGTRLAAERGWTMAPDGPYLRRVVPSPEPLRILELGVIRYLAERGVIVICTGGGGIPVAATDGGYRGVEAVIDKDLSAALLSSDLGVDLLVMLTDVEAVQLEWGRPLARPISSASPERLRELSFAAGSIGPKVEAACRFVERSGGRAAIGALEQGAAVVAGTAGTQVAKGAPFVLGG